jgi:hypothetical protein
MSLLRLQTRSTNENLELTISSQSYRKRHCCWLQPCYGPCECLRGRIFRHGNQCPDLYLRCTLYCNGKESFLFHKGSEASPN